MEDRGGGVAGDLLDCVEQSARDSVVVVDPQALRRPLVEDPRLGNLAAVLELAPHGGVVLVVQARRQARRVAAQLVEVGGEDTRQAGLADQHAVDARQQVEPTRPQALEQRLAKGLARLLLLADPVAERDRLVVVADQRLGAELVEPPQALAREAAAVQEVTGEDQPVAPLAESRAAQRVLEQLRVAVHVRHDQRERGRRPPSAGLHHVAVLHADHMPAPPAVRPVMLMIVVSSCRTRGKSCLNAAESRSSTSSSPRRSCCCPWAPPSRRLPPARRWAPSSGRRSTPRTPAATVSRTSPAAPPAPSTAPASLKPPMRRAPSC